MIRYSQLCRERLELPGSPGGRIVVSELSDKFSWDVARHDSTA
jgi:hypothetical protein